MSVVNAHEGVAPWLAVSIAPVRPFLSCRHPRGATSLGAWQLMMLRLSHSERYLVRLLLDRLEHRGDLDPFLLGLHSNQSERGHVSAPFPTRSASAHMSPSSWRPGGSCTHRLALDSSDSLKNVSARPPDPQQVAAPSPASLVPYAFSPARRPRAVNLALGSAGLALALPPPRMLRAACQ